MSDAPPPPPPPPAGGAWQQPAPGQATPGPLASWGQRFVAFIIDWVIILAAYVVVAIVAAIFGAVADVLGVLIGGVGYLVVAVASLYLYYLQGETGGTPGKRLTGLKVVGENDGQVTGGGMGIVRQFAHIIDAIPCYIGFLFPLWDEKRQTLADKVIKTVVLSDQPKMSMGPELFKTK